MSRPVGLKPTTQEYDWARPNVRLAASLLFLCIFYGLAAPILYKVSAMKRKEKKRMKSWLRPSLLLARLTHLYSFYAPMRWAWPICKIRLYIAYSFNGRKEQILGNEYAILFPVVPDPIYRIDEEEESRRCCSTCHIGSGTYYPPATSL